MVHYSLWSYWLEKRALITSCLHMYDTLSHSLYTHITHITDTLTLTLTLSHTHTLCSVITHTHTHSLSHTSLSLSLFNSLSHTHSLSLFNSLTHTLTHTLSHTLSLSLSRQLSHSPPPLTTHSPTRCLCVRPSPLQWRVSQWDSH